MNKNEALQLITDYEHIAMHGTKEESQEALESVTSALYQIIQSLEPGPSLTDALDALELTLPPLRD